MTRPEVADRMKAGVENRHQVHSEETRVSESSVSAAAARRVIGWGPWCRVGGPVEGREEVLVGACVSAVAAAVPCKRTPQNTLSCRWGRWGCGRMACSVCLPLSLSFPSFPTGENQRQASGQQGRQAGGTGLATVDRGTPRMLEQDRCGTGLCRFLVNARYEEWFCRESSHRARRHAKNAWLIARQESTHWQTCRRSVRVRRSRPRRSPTSMHLQRSLSIGGELRLQLHRVVVLGGKERCALLRRPPGSFCASPCFGSGPASSRISDDAFP